MKIFVDACLKEREKEKKKKKEMKTRVVGKR
jgi:hypothetical protein